MRILTKQVVTNVSEWPRVSWLMPVLNGMPYLRELLDSLVAQTYPHHEIIAWDNGSTDGSVALLQAYIPSRIAGRVVDQAALVGTIIAVQGRDGAPPYLVRWSNGTERLLFPGPDCLIVSQSADPG